ncbi:MAG TPA: hypothetical protein VJB95_00550 [Candidatus Paceibacterota bacterium]
MNPDAFTKKLYIPRNFEGKPNKRELAVLRKLEDELSNDLHFVGLVPHGSTVAGYSTLNSDLDVIAMHDCWEPEGEGKYVVKMLDTAKKITLKTGVPIHLVPTNVNIIKTQELNYLDGFDREKKLFEIVHILGVLTRLAIGGKVEQYRKAYIVWLKGLSVEKRKTIKTDLLALLFKRDDQSVAKRSQRIKDPEELTTILDERKDMWEKRVAKIWGL